MSPNPSRPPVPAWSSETPFKSASSSVTPGAATPRTSTFQRIGESSTSAINLTLSEDENSPKRAKSDSTSPHFSKSMQNAPVNADEEDEELYEYFPLSLDD